MLGVKAEKNICPILSEIFGYLRTNGRKYPRNKEKYPRKFIEYPRKFIEYPRNSSKTTDFLIFITYANFR